MEKEGIVLMQGWEADRDEVPRTIAGLGAYTPNPKIALHAKKIKFKKVISEIQPSAVGLSVTTYKEFALLGEKVAEVNMTVPDAIIVVGGMYPTLFTPQTMSIPGLDIVVRGYGEQSWQTLTDELVILPHLEKNKRTSLLKKRLLGYPGIYFAKNKSLPEDLAMSPRLPLSKIRQPDYSISYPSVSSYFEGKREYSILELDSLKMGVDVLSGIGCDNSCAFCVIAGQRMNDSSNPIVEVRSAVAVVEEVETLVNLAGVNKLPVFLACPDSFARIDHLVEILDLLQARNLNDRISLTVDAKVRSFYQAINEHPEIIRSLKGRLWRVILGVESLDSSIQEYIGKSVSLDELATILQFSSDAEIIPTVQMLIGLPPDSDQTLQRSLEQLLLLRDSVPPFAVKFHRAVPFPGTIFYSDTVAAGLMNGYEHGTFSEFTVGEALIGTKLLSKEKVTYWIERFVTDFLNRDYLLGAAKDSREGLAFEMKRVAESSGFYDAGG